MRNKLGQWIKGQERNIRVGKVVFRNQKMTVFIYGMEQVKRNVDLELFIKNITERYLKDMSYITKTVTKKMIAQKI
jgi:hypothetical protein